MSKEYDESIRKAAEAIGMGFNDSAIKAACDLGLLDEILECAYEEEENEDDYYISDEELAEEDYREAVNCRYYY